MPLRHACREPLPPCRLTQRAPLLPFSPQTSPARSGVLPFFVPLIIGGGDAGRLPAFRFPEEAHLPCFHLSLMRGSGICRPPTADVPEPGRRYSS